MKSVLKLSLNRINPASPDYPLLFSQRSPIILKLFVATEGRLSCRGLDGENGDSVVTLF